MFGTPTSMALPRNWARAHAFFEGRKFKERRYRNTERGNTAIHHIGFWPMPEGELPVYSVRLYATDIVQYRPDGTVKLEAYHSATTNSRYDDCGMPVIRTAKAMGIPKADRLEYASGRWYFGWFSSALREKYPYGVPSVDIEINADRTELLTIGGVPASEYKEALRVPIPDKHRERRSVLARTRALLKPVCQLLEVGNGQYLRFQFDELDAEILLRDAARGNADEVVSTFMDQHTYSHPLWTTPTNPPVKALEAQLRKLQPSVDKFDNRLWTDLMVNPADLPKELIA